MAEKLRITTENLARDAQSFKSKIKMMKHAVADMQEDIAQLNAMWSGPSHAAFVSAFDTDIIEAQELISSLSDFADNLEKAASEYSRCNNQVDSYIDAIRL